MQGRDPTRRHSIGLVAVLAIAGVAAGHSIAYGFVPASHLHGPGTAHVHGYMTVFVPVAIGVALVAVLQFALTARRGVLPPIPWKLLLCLQVALFVVQEAAERYLIDGQPIGVLGEPLLWIGVAVQAAVARAVPVLIRRTASLLRPWRLSATRPVVGPRRGVAPAPAAPVTVLAFLTNHVQRRGPPAFVPV